MFHLKVFNEEEVLACLKKAEKRKGKRTTLGEVPSGSLVRFIKTQDGKEEVSYGLDIVELDVPYEDGDCDCDLKSPGDTREYDGKTWHNGNFSA